MTRPRLPNVSLALKDLLHPMRFAPDTQGRFLNRRQPIAPALRHPLRRRHWAPRPIGRKQPRQGEFFGLVGRGHGRPKVCSDHEQVAFWKARRLAICGARASIGPLRRSPGTGRGNTRRPRPKTCSILGTPDLRASTRRKAESTLTKIGRWGRSVTLHRGHAHGHRLPLPTRIGPREDATLSRARKH